MNKTANTKPRNVLQKYFIVLLRYACLPGFLMEGDASQLCDATQSFTGDPPTCSLIDVSEDDSNTQEVAVQVEKAGGFDLSGNCTLKFIQCF